ncbi:LuxR C-terminal-related transcriptional regulator [Kitasatospora sp. NPDC057904]|uniref:LuxR C-terminal-related transcriptional regulator n=1 Tax=Kitasatospora sp. NPDC057904 TaxID=3346275 RepID=UPI0036D7C621
MLEPLGLSSDGERVYRTLLAQPSWKLTDIAAHLTLTDRHVRSALDELADLALLRPAGGPADELLPISPSVGLATLLARAEAELADRQRRIEATRAAVATIAAEHDGARARESITRHEGIEAVRARIEELAAATRTEMVSLNPNSAQTPDAKAASKPLNQQLLERGVAIRCIYQDSFRNDPATLAAARWLAELGGQTRTVPTVPLLMIVIDRETVLVPIDPANSRLGALELRSPGVVTAAYALFEQTWLNATPFGESATRDGNELTLQEREIIKLLADGHTDEIVARRLDLSTRTTRRVVAELMGRLDARSRFQAGLRIAERGWHR